MKAVLLSVQPTWCAKIANKEKTLEVRKSRPKIEMPFKCYIYETKGKADTPWMDEDGHLDFHGRGQVIGEFVCDRVYQYSTGNVEGQTISGEEMQKQSCLTYKELFAYENSAEARANCIYLIGLYGWHISALQIYDNPKELSEFSRFGFYGMGHSKVVCGNYSCKHFIKSYNYDEPPECGIDGCSLRRPPQSWYYVATSARG